MNKYLQFAVSGFEPLQIAINGGLTVGIVAATSIKLHSADSSVVYTIAGTDFTVAMGDAINGALVLAAQTNWTESVSTVQIPIGQVVTGVTIA
jgi:cytoskeletal protein CcmA (bactofilin family)